MAATILAAIALIASLIGPVLAYRAAVKSAAAQRDTARTSDIGTNTRWALEQVAKNDPRSRAAGVGMLRGLLARQDLTADDKRLIFESSKHVLMS